MAAAEAEEAAADAAEEAQAAVAALEEIKEKAQQHERTQEVIEEATTEGQVLRLGGTFSDCPADSIDYAVMEKTDKAAVVPLAAGWSDVGTWASLRDALPKDERGNVVRGPAICENCDDCLVIADDRRVAVAGLKSTIVVDTPQGVLVMAEAEHQALKQLVEQIKAERKA